MYCSIRDNIIVNNYLTIVKCNKHDTFDAYVFSNFVSVVH